VRSAITDDGRTPLVAPGLKLKRRLEAVVDSLDRVMEKGGSPAPLARLRHLIGRGMEDTAPLWPAVKCAYAWVHAAARLLNNDLGEPAGTGRRRLDELLGAMLRYRHQAGALVPAIEHFAKVARSYRPGLFHCYAVPGLPRTNNDLEQLFGSQRYHERRATGCKSASSTVVLRGEVR
jgi:hypothetical protein